VSTDFGGVLKMLFGELKMRFLPIATIQVVWYLQKNFDCVDVSKCVFRMKYDLHSYSSYFVSKLSPPIFRSTFSSVVGYMKVL
jgi:hypothetical protein